MNEDVGALFPLLAQSLFEQSGFGRQMRCTFGRDFALCSKSLQRKCPHHADAADATIGSQLPCNKLLTAAVFCVHSVGGQCFLCFKAVFPSAQFYLVPSTHVSVLKQLTALSPAALSAFIFSFAVCSPNNSFALTFTAASGGGSQRARCARLVFAHFCGAT